MAEQAAPGASAADPGPTAVVFKKKNRGNVRKRATADEEGSGGEGDETAVIRKAKQTKGDPLAFSTKREDKEQVTFAFESNKALQMGNSDATRMLETETEFDRDARCVQIRRRGFRGRRRLRIGSHASLAGCSYAPTRRCTHGPVSPPHPPAPHPRRPASPPHPRCRSARREAVLKQGVEGALAAGNADGKYKGMNSYVDYRAGFRREHTVGSEKGTGAHGPLRASVFIRSSARRAGGRRLTARTHTRTHALGGRAAPRGTAELLPLPALAPTRAHAPVRPLTAPSASGARLPECARPSAHIAAASPAGGVQV